MGKGKKFHKTTDGRILPCVASIRTCPLQHFVSEADAQDDRIRFVSGAQHNDVVTFDISYTVDSLGNIQQDSDNSYTLESMGKEVESRLRTTGRRPRFPSGTIEAELGYGRRLSIQRENFLKYGTTPTTRYYITFWNNEYDYKVYDAEIRCDREDLAGYRILQNKIQSLYTHAREKFVAELDEKVNLGTMSNAVRAAHVAKFDDALSSSYNRILSDIGQIEVMTNGADKALSNYGIDVFDHTDPAVMEFNVDCSEMSVTSRDLVDSLRSHAVKDTDAKGVALRLTDTNHRGGKVTSRWSLVRESDGKWFFSGQTPTSTEVRPIDPQSPEDREAIATFINGNSRDFERKNAMVQNLLRELDPAVSSYEKTVVARRSTPVVPEIAPVEKTSVKSRMFKIFG